MIQHQYDTVPRERSSLSKESPPAHFTFWKEGRDIQVIGLLLLFAGSMDLIWIAAYPGYSLKIFGSTFGGLAGEIVKYQHPLIHWLLGYGFWKQRLWAFYGYLFYLSLGCLSEVMTQLTDGFHITRTTLIIISLFFGCYILYRRPAFHVH